MAASRLRQPGYSSGVSPHYGGGGSGAYASASSSPTGSPYMAYGPAYAPSSMPMMVPAGMGMAGMGGGSPVMMMGGGGGGGGAPAYMVGGGGGYGGYGGGGYGGGGGGADHLGERGSMLDLMSGAWHYLCVAQTTAQSLPTAAVSLNAPPTPTPHTSLQRATSCSTRGTWRPGTSGSSASGRCASAWPTRRRRPCTRKR